MKNMRTIGRIISAVLVLALLSGLLTACNGNGRGDRETTFTGETKNTVNPNISEPNQSIASGAMIPETTTSEATTEVKNGGTYTINGVEFTISHPIEDYIYTLPGSSSKYIDLDKFMEAYGLKRTDGEDAKELGYKYEKEGAYIVSFDRSEFSLYNNDNLGVCNCVTFNYSKRTEGLFNVVWLSNDYPTDLKDGVYGVNAVKNDKGLWVKYCVSREMLVVLAVMFDCQNKTGSTAGCSERLLKAISYTHGTDYLIK